MYTLAMLYIIFGCILVLFLIALAIVYWLCADMRKEILSDLKR
jgi:CHASE3 domain sensor protein